MASANPAVLDDGRSVAVVEITQVDPHDGQAGAR
jgi:hypothetical protein